MIYRNRSPFSDTYIIDYLPREWYASLSPLTAVNFPEVSLPAIREDVSRLLHIHKNVPGVMRQINEIFAKENINVAAQYLQTNADIGYVVMDIHSADPASVVTQLKKIEGTLKCRILY